MSGRIAVLLGSLFLASHAFAVSRVGGGVLSNDEMGFQTLLPPRYISTAVFPKQDIQLTIASWSGLSMNSRPRINLYLLANGRPDLVDISNRQEFKERFNSNWIHLQHLNTCVEVFTYETSGAFTYVLGWGAGHGVVLVGPNEPNVHSTLQFMVDSLTIDPASCSWK